MTQHWQNNYIPPIPSLWHGRADSLTSERFFQIVQCLDLRQPLPTSNTTPAFAIIGFCCDEGVRRNLGRVGAANGPQALRECLGNLPLQNNKSFLLYDVGNIICQGEALELAQAALGEVVKQLLQNGIHPIVLGGGHETAWGHYQGIARAELNSNLGIINFDAHFDLRSLPESDRGNSGTPFLQIAQVQSESAFHYACIGIQNSGNTKSLFATAKRLNTVYLAAEEIHLTPLSQHLAFIDNFIRDRQHLYVTVCLDVFASAFAPGVSAPQPGGIFPWHVIPLLQHLAKSGKMLTLDVVELSPPLDRDNMTAKLGATLIVEYLHAMFSDFN